MKVEVDIEMTPERLAAMWAGMDSGQQAQFFVEAAKVMDAWPSPARSETQMCYLGEALAGSTEGARKIIEDLHWFMHSYMDGPFDRSAADRVADAIAKGGDGG